MPLGVHFSNDSHFLKILIQASWSMHLLNLALCLSYAHACVCTKDEFCWGTNFRPDLCRNYKHAVALLIYYKDSDTLRLVKTLEQDKGLETEICKTV